MVDPSCPLLEHSSFMFVLHWHPCKLCQVWMCAHERFYWLTPLLVEKPYHGTILLSFFHINVKVVLRPDPSLWFLVDQSQCWDRLHGPHLRGTHSAPEEHQSSTCRNLSNIFSKWFSDTELGNPRMRCWWSVAVFSVSIAFQLEPLWALPPIPCPPPGLSPRLLL